MGYKMRLFLTVALLSLAITATAQSNSIRNDQPIFLYGQRLFFGGEVPLPMGKMIVFPWENMSGTWMIQNEATNVFFSFQVQRAVGGGRLLRVTQLDRNTRTILAQGVGIADQEGKVVRAVMKGLAGNFMVFVRVFRDDDPRLTRPRQVTVISIRGFNGEGEPAGNESHFILRKVSANPITLR